MGQIIETGEFDTSQLEGKKRHIYNTLRSALAGRDTTQEELEVIVVGPIKLAIRKELSQDVIDIAHYILNHPFLLDGIQTKDLLEFYEEETYQKFGWEPFYHPMLAVIATAVGIKEQLLKYSEIVYKIYPNLENPLVTEYLEAIHGKSL